MKSKTIPGFSGVFRYFVFTITGVVLTGIFILLVRERVKIPGTPLSVEMPRGYVIAYPSESNLNIVHEKDKFELHRVFPTFDIRLTGHTNAYRPVQPLSVVLPREFLNEFSSPVQHNFNGFDVYIAQHNGTPSHTYPRLVKALIVYENQYIVVVTQGVPDDIERAYDMTVDILESLRLDEK